MSDNHDPNDELLTEPVPIRELIPVIQAAINNTGNPEWFTVEEKGNRVVTTVKINAGGKVRDLAVTYTESMSIRVSSQDGESVRRLTRNDTYRFMRSTVSFLHRKAVATLSKHGN